jgi:histone acetyltransferase 1
LKNTDRSRVDEYRAYRLFVKNRLNGPYQKQQKDLEKLRKRGVDQLELVAAVSMASKEERLRQLHNEYQNVERDYMLVINKLADN